MIQKKRLEDAAAGEKYIKWLSELSSKSGSVAGGKGANLAEMYNAKFPVPPAFIITAQAFDAYLKAAGLKEEIKKIIGKTNVFNTKELEENSKEIREMVANAEMSEDMQNEIIEAYHILGGEKETETEMLESSKNKKTDKDVFVAVRSSATTEDLAAASFAGQQETYTNIKGDKNLIHAVKKCFASLYTARAVYYRHKKGFEKVDALLSVVVQKMINSEKSGVVFTKNPTTEVNEVVVEAVFGLGEGIVSGKVKPDHYIVSPELEIIEKKIAVKRTAIIKQESGEEKLITLPEKKSKEQVLSDGQIKMLANICIKIEEHYKKPQDIEFAVENDKIFIVQSRPITTIGEKGDKEKRAMKVEGEIVLSGLPASPGVASGIVKIVYEMKDLDKIKKGDVLVTKMTNPDMVITMQKSIAVVTDEGGATAHAAIVSREMGIPCVVGTDNATEVLKDGMKVTVDGTNGRVYKGELKVINGEEQHKKEILPIVKGTKTKIKVMIDLPDFAERAAKSEAESVGLLRLEGIIASSGKHPLMFMRENKTNEYSKVIEQGIAKISKHFKNIWIRTSDIRSDEFQHLQGAPKTIEVNPMLGNHGIRFSLKNLPLFEAEIEAVMNIAEKHPDKKFGIMFPQVISEEEMAEAFKIFKKYQKKNMIIGAMIETPAAVQVIRGICKYAKFISFGTNDLTQFTLAIDRGNSDVQYLYNEMHPAVLSQLKRVIDICKEYHVETSICGQAGSKKEMVEYLVKLGINSISVNADIANEISQFVLDLESGKIKNSNDNDNNMAKKAKILPIDELSEVKEKGEERNHEVMKENKKKEKKNADDVEVTKEPIKEESKAEEYPVFEMGIDPFQQQ